MVLNKLQSVRQHNGHADSDWVTVVNVDWGKDWVAPVLTFFNFHRELKK